MNRLCHNRLLSTIILALTMIGWFAISNHCSLSGMARLAQAKSEHACCPGEHSKPADQPVDSGLECCKSLHAPASGAVKAISIAPSAFVVANLIFVQRLDAASVPPIVFASDTGPPPDVQSFSELVLHRSLRSHAPPSLG